MIFNLASKLFDWWQPAMMAADMKPLFGSSVRRGRAPDVQPWLKRPLDGWGHDGQLRCC